MRGVVFDEITAWCPLCGAKFCNIFALDEHFRVYHDRALTAGKIFTRKRTLI
jgi:hypothetical protein